MSISVKNKQFLSKFALLCLITSITTACHTQEISPNLPLIPRQIENPYQPAAKDITIKGAKALAKIFAEHDYGLDAVQQTQLVPKLYVTNLPNNLAKQAVDNKINDFIRLLIPNILLVNKQIEKVRHALWLLNEIPKEQWSDKQKYWLNQLAKNYNLGSEQISIHTLLQYIDIIPVSMALAQGIDESGWGSSYFAIKGNALYGEHLPAHAKHYLTTPNGKIKVAAFNSLYQGTAAYIHNLNTGRAYQQLRELRSQLRTSHQLTGYNLVAALEHYSIRGEHYVNNLRALIHNHQLDRYDEVTFNPRSTAEIIRLKM